MRHAPRLFFTALAFLLGATAAHAQIMQRSFSLNEAAPGNEYLSVPIKNGLDGNAAYTIEAWVYPTSYENYPTIVGNSYATSYWLGLNTSGRVRFYPRGWVSGFVESPQVVPLNRWTHVAATYVVGLGYGIFIDGNLVLSGSSINGAVPAFTGDLRIGADREVTSPDYFWRGYLDDVRIWSVLRTATQIRAHMFVGVGRPANFASGAYNGLEAAWGNEFYYSTHVQDYGGGVFNDASFVNGDHLTHITHPAFGPPLAPNVALSLNGVDDRAVLPVTENFGRGVTVMGWIAPTTASGFRTIAGREYLTSFMLGLTNNNYLRFIPRGGEAVDGVTSIPVDRWTHVAATYDGERTVLYINGVVDEISTAIAGPVGANGHDVWVGANNGAFLYPFLGYLDDVVVAQGALSRSTIRRLMFHGFAYTTPVFEVYDQDGVPVDAFLMSFDAREEFYTVLGSGARLVRGGTSAVAPLSELAFAELQDFAWHPGGGSSLPDDDLAVSVGSNLEWPLAEAPGLMRVFISAPLTDLAQTKIRLRSPAGTWVTLLNSSAAVGRDLLTVVSDDAPVTWQTGWAPYHNGVQPSETLDAFDGENPQGQWRLEISSAGTGGVGLWSWGLQVNYQQLDADPIVPAAVALSLAGANPVRGTGTLALEIPVAADVDLALLDVQGREVLPVSSGHHPAGSYRFAFSAGALPAGVYFARLRLDGEDRTSVKVSVVR
jgi:hypothetical protein